MSEFALGQSEGASAALATKWDWPFGPFLTRSCCDHYFQVSSLLTQHCFYNYFKPGFGVFFWQACREQKRRETALEHVHRGMFIFSFWCLFPGKEK